MYVTMAQGLLPGYFSPKSPCPFTVSNVKHRIEKFLHSGFKFICLKFFFRLSKL